MKNSKKSRHTTERKSKKSTYPVPSISLGKRERVLLYHLNSIKNIRFNIKEFSKDSKKIYGINIPKSSVYDILYRLEKLEFVNIEQGNNKISEKGIIYLETHNLSDTLPPVGSVGDKKKNLSTHYHTFKFKIEKRDKFKYELIDKLKPLDKSKNILPNLSQYFIKFHDATIIINPKQVQIRLLEYISKDTDETDLKSFEKALEYEKRIRSIGIITSGVFVEDAHWARVKSALADYLYNKVDKRYYLELDNGKKFWIDCSGGKEPEDETNDKVFRNNIDKSLDVLGEGFDLLKLEEVVRENKDNIKTISQLESIRLLKEIEESKERQKELEVRKLELENKTELIKKSEINFNNYIN